MLFKLCTNLLDFYRKIGIEDKIRWFDRMTFIEPGGRQSVLESISLPAPLHAAPAFMKFKFLSLRDKLALTRALNTLMTRNPEDDGTSFQDWLQRHGQTPRSIEYFWKPILVSALSEDLDLISIPYAAQVVRESMKSREARLMGVPMVPLTELYNAAKDYIVAHGGDIRFRANVQSFTPALDGVRIKLQDSEEQFDYGVIAVPAEMLGKLLPVASQSESLREKTSHFQNAPITGVHFWFDRQISDLPHAVLLGRSIQWMFHKSLLLQRSGNEDSGQSQPVAYNLNAPAPQGRTSLAQGGSPGYGEKTTESQRDGTEKPSYVELVISSSKSLINKSRQEIIDLALNELREFFPAAREANLVKATVIKEVNATFSPRPGIDAYRPSQQTPWSRMFLAGDWTATGWPATMEGAVRSGYLAAEQLTKTAGSPKQFLVADLPARGLNRFFFF